MEFCELVNKVNRLQNEKTRLEKRLSYLGGKLSRVEELGLKKMYVTSDVTFHRVTFDVPAELMTDVLEVMIADCEDKLFGVMTDIKGLI